MTLTPFRLALATLSLAVLLAPAVAWLVVVRLEARLVAEITTAIGADWVVLESDGLVLRLSGTAPDEAARFAVFERAAAAAGPARLVDAIEVAPAHPVAAPAFALELLRGDGGVSIIGLVPGGPGARDALAAEIGATAPDLSVTDMLEAADYPAPEGWAEARGLALVAVATLDRARISAQPGRVVVTALAPSPEARRDAEAALRRAAPAGLEMVLEITAPLEPITPFLLRFSRTGEGGAELAPCAADTEEAAARILAAAEAAGLAPGGTCRIGLGAPSPDWAAAASAGIAAVAELGGGALTLRGPDMALRPAPGADMAAFARVAGELEARLPPGFSLRAEEGPAEGADTGPVAFLASLSPEGQLRLRGPVPDAALRAAVLALARARFEGAELDAALRLRADLPARWPLRMMSGLDALAMLENGSLTLTPTGLQITGLAATEARRDAVVALLAEALGGQGFEARLRVAPPPPPEAVASTAPDPAECLRQIEEILARQKIVFAPGSTGIEGEAVGIVGEIARVLRRCPEARLEIGGHTDSQGREEMNLALSEKRAQAVLDALRARRVLVGNITARGYGESAPIADNATEEGREANRRIAFRLIAPEEGANAEEASAEGGAKGGPENGDAPAEPPAGPAAEPAAEPAADPPATETPAQQEAPNDPD